MAMYAFDGTGNECNEDPAENTNVLKFVEAYEITYSGAGECFYVPGVGTRKSIVGKIFGSVFGAGGDKRIEEAVEACEKNFALGDRNVDVIGFSRGAALAWSSSTP